jgi:hypothetical protein
MEKGLDTGDMIEKVEIPIEANDTGSTLHDKLAVAGGKLILTTLEALKDGTAVREKQDLAVTIADVTADNYESGKYYIADPVSYGVGNTMRTYEFDTKEYRAEKFTNEIIKHFDMEYLATYFVATEVFECYDSRGKNCMMASWGPKEEGGYYIWYPVFYDIDT